MPIKPLLRSERLVYHPLSIDELVTYLKGEDRLERLLGLNFGRRVVSPEVRDMAEFYSLPKMNLAGREARLFLTFWIVVDVELNQIVAELGFKGTPDQNSEIEIGYATLIPHQRRGYMTEAVGTMCKWALARPDVRGVIAEIDRNNLASIQVVTKNGFVQFEQHDKMLWWRKKRPSNPLQSRYN